MFSYKYYELKVSGFLNFKHSERPDHVITRYAAEGWKYVDSIPLKWDSHGRSKSTMLVFERPKGLGSKYGKICSKNCVISTF